MSLGDLYSSVRRDVIQVTRNLLGRRQPPFTRRHPVAKAGGPRSLRITNLTRHTPDAMSIELDSSGEPLAFIPGQFFTLLVPVGNETVRRAYSASSSARDGSRVTVTVKRVAGGRVSNHLHDTLAVGQALAVLGPSGSFGPAPAASARHLVLVAGGSGITPMMSIVRTLLASEPDTRFTLLYGNRREEDIIFYPELRELAGERLHVRHVLSEPPKKWSGGKGLLDEEVAAAELARLDKGDDLPREYFLCGPEPMMAAVRKVLLARGVAAEQIHEERFLAPHRPTVAEAAAPQSALLRSRGKERIFPIGAGQTLLEAGLAAGAAMPFSCTMGGCAACRVKLVSGEVVMDEPNCLTPEERAQGHVLACVARAQSPLVVELP